MKWKAFVAGVLVLAAVVAAGLYSDEVLFRLTKHGVGREARIPGYRRRCRSTRAC